MKKFLAALSLPALSLAATLGGCWVGGYDDPCAGGASLRMWADYFPRALVVGLGRELRVQPRERGVGRRFAAPAQHHVNLSAHQGERSPKLVGCVSREPPQAFEGRLEAGTHRAMIVGAEGNSRRFESATVMALEDAGHQECRRMHTEIGRKISDTNLLMAVFFSSPRR